MRLWFGSHARDMMLERGISVTEVERAIQRGAKFLQKPNKIVSEYTYFSVVYKKIGECYYVITVQPRW